MRVVSISLITFAIAIHLLAAKKGDGTRLSGEGQNSQASVQASLLSPDEVNQALDHDFGGHFTVVEVRITPMTRPLALRLDDFLLRTDKDGERSTPFAANQIAGTGAITVHQREPANVANGQSGQGLHIPGLSGRLKSKKTEPKKTAEEAPKDPAPMDDKEAAELKTRLAAKVLPEKNVTEVTTGLLFFSLEKQKPKDLELIYSIDPANKIRLRFK